MRDYVMMWNSVAMELNRRDHTGKMNAKNNKGPTKSSRALAIVHIAMHDAFFGLKNRPSFVVPTIDGLSNPINPYLGAALPAAADWSDENVAGAVSGAASKVLLVLYPDFEYLIQDALRGFDFGSNHPGFTFGEKVAEAVLNLRNGDGSEDNGNVIAIKAFWRHREDPTDLGQGLLGERWGAVKPFSMAAIPPIADHPAPRSAAYNDAHNEVRVKGSLNPTPGTPGVTFEQRTPYETTVGIYWAYDGASQIGTPPRLYNQIIREIIARNLGRANPNRQAVSARLLALANVAMGDAGIAAWYYKYIYQLWRPILGIREYDDSFWMNNQAQSSFGLHPLADPWWIPLGAPRTNEPGRDSFTPPFPAYPSGHATFGAAAFEVTRRFFGFKKNQMDDLRFDFVSDELDGRSIAQDGSFRGRHIRRYNSLMQAIFDNSVSRVFLGVHWRFDGIGENVKNAAGILTDTSNIGGVPLGRAIANQIYDNGMVKSSAGPARIEPKDLPGVNLPPLRP